MSTQGQPCSVCNSMQDNPVLELNCNKCDYLTHTHILCINSLQCPQCGDELLTPMERLENDLGGKPIITKD